MYKISTFVKNVNFCLKFYLFVKNLQKNTNNNQLVNQTAKEFKNLKKHVFLKSAKREKSENDLEKFKNGIRNLMDKQTEFG